MLAKTVTKSIALFLKQFSQDVVRKVENVEVDGSTPKKEVKIADCGVIEVDEPFNVERED